MFTVPDPEQHLCREELDHHLPPAPGPGHQPARKPLAGTRAANYPSAKFSQSRRWPLLALSHLRHYWDTKLNRHYFTV